jgi:hypothetical protein
MAELKIKTHTTYTYETSDGRVFDIAEEAQKWQQALEDIKGITMLDSKFTPTTEVDSAFYVLINTYSQLEAFEAMQAYEGITAHIPDIGWWYYDEVVDEFVDIEKEISRLKDIIYKLSSAKN